MIQTVSEEPLGVVAAQVRSQLDPNTNDLAINMRDLATLLSRSTDKTKVSFTTTAKIPSDFVIGCWSRINCYELDFNLGLGKIKSVGRPHFIPFESLGIRRLGRLLVRWLLPFV
jgi:hypothetical protein